MQMKKRRINSTSDAYQQQSQQQAENADINQQYSQSEMPKNNSSVSSQNGPNIGGNSNNNSSSSNQANNLLYKISILSPIKKHPRSKGRKNVYSMHNGEQNYYDEMSQPQQQQQHISHYSSSNNNISLEDGNLNAYRNMQNTNFLDSDFSIDSGNNNSFVNTPKIDLIESRQIGQGKKNDILSRQRKQVVGKYQSQLPSLSGSAQVSIGDSSIQTRKQSTLNSIQTPQKVTGPNKSNILNKKIVSLYNQNTNSSSNSNVLTQDNDQSSSNFRNLSLERYSHQQSSQNTLDYQNQYNPGMYGMKARKLIDLSDQPSSQQFGSKNNIRQSSLNSKENSLNNSLIGGQHQQKSNNNMYNYKQPPITYQAVYGSDSDPVDKKDYQNSSSYTNNNNNNSTNTPVKQITVFQKEGISLRESFSQTPEAKPTIKLAKLDRTIESQISQTVSVNNNNNFDEPRQFLQANQSQKQTPIVLPFTKNQITKNNSHQPNTNIKVLKNKSNISQNQGQQINSQQQYPSSTTAKNGVAGKLTLIKNPLPKQINTEGGSVYSENETYGQKFNKEQISSSNITSKKNSLVLVKQQPPSTKFRTNPKIIRINQIQNMNELFPENVEQVSHAQIVIQDGKIIQKPVYMQNTQTKQYIEEQNKATLQQQTSVENPEQVAGINEYTSNQSKQSSGESNYVTFKNIPVSNSNDPTQYSVFANAQLGHPDQNPQAQSNQNLNSNQHTSTSQVTQQQQMENSKQQQQNQQNIQQSLETYSISNDQDIKEDQMRNSGGSIGVEYTKDGIEVHKGTNLSSCFSHSALSQCSVQTIGIANRKKINLTMLVAYGEQLAKLNELFQENEQSSQAPHHLIDNPAFLQNLLQKCHWFLDIVNTEKDLEQLPLLFKDEKSRKIIKQSMVFERCTIVMIAQNLLDRDVFSSNYKYLKGVVYYAYQNYINTISIIHHKMSNQLTFSKLNTNQSTQQLNFINSTTNTTTAHTQNSSQITSNKSNNIICNNNSNVTSNTNTTTTNNCNNLNMSLNQDEKINGPMKNTIEEDIDDDEEIDVYTKQQFLKMVRRTSVQQHNHQQQQHGKPPQKWVVTLLNQIRQNNEITINSFKTLAKNDKEFYQYILNYIKSIDRSSSVNVIYYQMLSYFSLYLIQKYQQMDSPLHFSIPFLSTAPAPYLPEMDKKHSQYTLVLDLDETLIHYREAYGNVKQFVVRPYVQTFLQQISEFYEIIVFTAGMPDYANWVINNFDTKGYIKHRLYRQHTIQIQNTFIKDLSRIGRDLSKVIIIDNLAENFQFQPDNGIFIREWTEDPTDTALAELLPLLKEIVIKKSTDVRIALKQLKEQIQKNIEEGIEYPHLNLKL